MDDSYDKMSETVNCSKISIGVPFRSSDSSYNLNQVDGYKVQDETILNPRSSVESDLSFPSTTPSLLDEIRSGLENRTFMKNKGGRRKNVSLDFSLSSSLGSLNSTLDTDAKSVATKFKKSKLFSRPRKKDLNIDFTLGNESSSSIENEQPNESNMNLSIIPSSRPIFKRPHSKRVSVKFDCESDDSKASIENEQPNDLSINLSKNSSSKPVFKGLKSKNVSVKFDCEVSDDSKASLDQDSVLDVSAKLPKSRKIGLRSTRSVGLRKREGLYENVADFTLSNSQDSDALEDTTLNPLNIQFSPIAEPREEEPDGIVSTSLEAVKLKNVALESQPSISCEENQFDAMSADANTENISLPNVTSERTTKDFKNSTEGSTGGSVVTEIQYVAGVGAPQGEVSGGIGMRSLDQTDEFVGNAQSARHTSKRSSLVLPTIKEIPVPEGGTSDLPKQIAILSEKPEVFGPKTFSQFLEEPYTDNSCPIVLPAIQSSQVNVSDQSTFKQNAQGSKFEQANKSYTTNLIDANRCSSCDDNAPLSPILRPTTSDVNTEVDGREPVPCSDARTHAPSTPITCHSAPDVNSVLQDIEPEPTKENTEIDTLLPPTAFLDAMSDKNISKQKVLSTPKSSSKLEFENASRGSADHATQPTIRKDVHTDTNGCSLARTTTDTPLSPNLSVSGAISEAHGTQKVPGIVECNRDVIVESAVVDAPLQPFVIVDADTGECVSKQGHINSPIKHEIVAQNSVNTVKVASTDSAALPVPITGGQSTVHASTDVAEQPNESNMNLSIIPSPRPIFKRPHSKRVSVKFDCKSDDSKASIENEQPNDLSINLSKNSSSKPVFKGLKSKNVSVKFDCEVSDDSKASLDQDSVLDVSAKLPKSRKIGLRSTRSVGLRKRDGLYENVADFTLSNSQDSDALEDTTLNPLNIQFSPIAEPREEEPDGIVSTSLEAVKLKNVALESQPSISCEENQFDAMSADVNSENISLPNVTSERTTKDFKNSTEGSTVVTEIQYVAGVGAPQDELSGGIGMRSLDQTDEFVGNAQSARHTSKRSSLVLPTIKEIPVPEGGTSDLPKQIAILSEKPEVFGPKTFSQFLEESYTDNSCPIVLPAIQSSQVNVSDQSTFKQNAQGSKLEQSNKSYTTNLIDANRCSSCDDNAPLSPILRPTKSDVNAEVDGREPVPCSDARTHAPSTPITCHSAPDVNSVLQDIEPEPTKENTEIDTLLPPTAFLDAMSDKNISKQKVLSIPKSSSKLEFENASRGSADHATQPTIRKDVHTDTNGCSLARTTTGTPLSPNLSVSGAISEAHGTQKVPGIVECNRDVIVESAVVDAPLQPFVIVDADTGECVSKQGHINSPIKHEIVAQNSVNTVKVASTDSAALPVPITGGQSTVHASTDVAEQPNESNMNLSIIPSPRPIFKRPHSKRVSVKFDCKSDDSKASIENEQPNDLSINLSKNSSSKPVFKGLKSKNVSVKFDCEVSDDSKASLDQDSVLDVSAKLPKSRKIGLRSTRPVGLRKREGLYENVADFTLSNSQDSDALEDTTLNPLNIQFSPIAEPREEEPDGIVSTSLEAVKLKNVALESQPSISCEENQFDAMSADVNTENISLPNVTSERTTKDFKNSTEGSTGGSVVTEIQYVAGVGAPQGELSGGIGMRSLDQTDEFVGNAQSARHTSKRSSLELPTIKEIPVPEGGTSDLPKQIAILSEKPEVFGPKTFSQFLEEPYTDNSCPIVLPAIQSSQVNVSDQSTFKQNAQGSKLEQANKSYTTNLIDANRCSSCDDNAPLSPILRPTTSDVNAEVDGREPVPCSDARTHAPSTPITCHSAPDVNSVLQDIEPEPTKENTEIDTLLPPTAFLDAMSDKNISKQKVLSTPKSSSKLEFENASRGSVDHATQPTIRKDVHTDTNGCSLARTTTDTPLSPNLSVSGAISEAHGTQKVPGIVECNRDVIVESAVVDAPLQPFVIVDADTGECVSKQGHINSPIKHEIVAQNSVNTVKVASTDSAALPVPITGGQSTVHASTDVCNIADATTHVPLSPNIVHISADVNCEVEGEPLATHPGVSFGGPIRENAVADIPLPPPIIVDTANRQTPTGKLSKSKRKSVSFKPTHQNLYHSPPEYHSNEAKHSASSSGPWKNGGGYDEFSKIQMTSELSEIQTSVRVTRSKKHYSSTPLPKPKKPRTSSAFEGKDLHTMRREAKHDSVIPANPVSRVAPTGNEFLVPPPPLFATKHVTAPGELSPLNPVDTAPQSPKEGEELQAKSGDSSSSEKTSVDLSYEHSLNISAIPRDLAGPKWGNVFHSTPLRRSEPSKKKSKKKASSCVPHQIEKENLVVDRSINTTLNLRSQSRRESVQSKSDSSSQSSDKSKHEDQSSQESISRPNVSASGKKSESQESSTVSPQPVSNTSSVDNSSPDRISIKDNTVLSSQAHSHSRARDFASPRSNRSSYLTRGSSLSSYDSHRKMPSRRLFTRDDVVDEEKEEHVNQEEHGSSTGSNDVPCSANSLSAPPASQTDLLDDDGNSNYDATSSRPPSFSRDDSISGSSAESVAPYIVPHESLKSQIDSLRRSSRASSVSSEESEVAAPRHLRPRPEPSAFVPKVPRSKFSSRPRRPQTENSLIFPKVTKRRPAIKCAKTDESSEEWFKRPRKLFKPGKWASKKLYDWLDNKLRPVYGLKTTLMAEKVVIDLQHAFLMVSNGHLDGALEAVRKRTIELKLCTTELEFWSMIHKWMPFDFRMKVMPLGGAFGSSIRPRTLPYTHL